MTACLIILWRIWTLTSCRKLYTVYCCIVGYMGLLFFYNLTLTMQEAIISSDSCGGQICLSIWNTAHMLQLCQIDEWTKESCLPATALPQPLLNIGALQDRHFRHNIRSCERKITTNFIEAAVTMFKQVSCVTHVHLYKQFETNMDNMIINKNNSCLITQQSNTYLTDI